MVGRAGNGAKRWETTPKSGKNLPFRTAFSHLRPKWQYSGGRERGGEIGPSLRSSFWILYSEFLVFTFFLSKRHHLAHPIALSNPFPQTKITVHQFAPLFQPKPHPTITVHQHPTRS